MASLCHHLVFINLNAMQEEMEGVKAVLLAIVFIAAQIPHVLSFPTTAPAFLWSPHHLGYEFILYVVFRLCNFNIILTID